MAEMDQVTADAKPKQLSVAQAYGDYKKLLADPPSGRAPVPRTRCTTRWRWGAEGGKIASEKPLAMNSKSQPSWCGCKRDGKINAVDFNYRFIR